MNVEAVVNCKLLFLVKRMVSWTIFSLVVQAVLNYSYNLNFLLLYCH